MSWNFKLFQKINSLVGKNPWLDAFGRAGAEWVIVAMLFWYGVSAYIANMPSKRAVFWPILFLGTAWAIGWLINVLLGMLAKEPRPHVTHPESKLLFTPLMSWKSFPSDHAMSAWVIFFMALVFNFPLAWALLPLALWVCWGRVFSGVHYPFDTVGGLIVAGVVSLGAYWALTAVLQL